VGKEVRLRLSVLVLTALLPIPALPQAANFARYGQLDANRPLFTVAAALNAAGYDADLDSPTNHPLRKAIRDHLAGRNLTSLPALQRFVRDHRQADPAADLSQYISFALLSKGPPDFNPARGDFPQPPDAAALYELPPLLAEFEQEANLEALWQQAQPYYEQALAQYTEPVALAVQQANAYLRNPNGGMRGRRFQIFLELLGAPNQVHTRIYLDDYIVVVTPSAELRIDEIRHHYLNYLADPLPLRYGEKLARLRPLGDFALGSPILPQKYKDSFSELATESFIRALEARIARRPAMAEQAAREGFVLTPVFYDQLQVYEAQERELAVYFPELLDNINLRKESDRLDKISFVSERTERTVRVTAPAKPPELTGVAKTLEEAEELLRAAIAGSKFDQLARPREVFSRALAETAEKPMQAKAYYGLARIAILERDPETGDQLFRKVLELDPDGATKAWSLLYLGKLSDSQGQAEPAKEFYRQALGVSGLPDQVRKEAEQGLQGAFTRTPGQR
jgi:tetratricopeptide (TPR) repeat protein